MKLNWKKKRKCSGKRVTRKSRWLNRKIEEISRNSAKNPSREQKYQEALIRGDHCCCLCDKKFKNSAALIAHKKTCTGLDIRCELCGDQFESRKKLSKHFNVAHNKMNHVCFVCGSAFKQKWLLEEHIARHSDARPFKCDICKSAFSSKETLKIHIHSKHLPNFVGHKCTMCDKSYATNSKLKRHMKSRHHVDGTFICGSCSVAFGTEGALDKHMRNMHTPMDQKTRYKCSFCMHTSTSQSRIQEHELGHSDESKWPFSCVTCGKRFVQKHSLERHQTIHLGIKPFSCESCGQSFRLSYQLKAHLQTHQTDSKPFQCMYCSKSYRDKTSFNKHVESHYVKNEEESENVQKL
ncbi:gastrula zinc finger protein XlCGF64.1-like [Culicoides brevitarsis]|uniref:gastrula zinc finger protein XlCGF64.1-like n=1 Tax=Culicoides brevitarsis TaxID=469753 RepID=UPI00307C6CBF